MFAWASALAAGIAAKNTCAEMAPCRSAGLALGGKPFKLSFVIHSATFERGDAKQRPYVNVAVADRSKRTELGDSSKDGAEWRFGETLTLEVKPGEEVVISVHSSQQYDLVVAALALSSQQIGEVCFPVSMVLPKLKLEDRDIDGIVYVTPKTTFDLISQGAKVGKIVLALETKQPPPQKTVSASSGSDPWCAFGAPRLVHLPACSDEDNAAAQELMGAMGGDMTQRSSVRETPMPSARHQYQDVETPRYEPLSPESMQQSRAQIHQQASPQKQQHAQIHCHQERPAHVTFHTPYKPPAVPSAPPAPPQRKSQPRF